MTLETWVKCIKLTTAILQTLYVQCLLTVYQLAQLLQYIHVIASNVIQESMMLFSPNFTIHLHIVVFIDISVLTVCVVVFKH